MTYILKTHLLLPTPISFQPSTHNFQQLQFCIIISMNLSLIPMFTEFTHDSIRIINNILINDTYRGMAGVLMFGRVQSLAESKIGRFRVEERIGLVYVIQGATAERHH